MSDQPAGTEEVTRWATTRLELTEALRQAQAGRLYVTDSFEAADALLEHLTPLPGESAAVPEPVMVLLEDAWNLISDAAQFAPGRPGWDSAADAWRVQYESVVRAHAAGPAREAAGELGRTLTEFLASACGVPHRDTTHYLIIADWDGGMHLETCCDDVGRVAGLLSAASRQVGAGFPDLSAASGRVIVSRSDLSAILAAAWGMTGDAGAFNRLAEACGLVHP